MIPDNYTQVRRSRVLQAALTMAALTIMIGQPGSAQQMSKLSVMPLPKSVEMGQGEYKLDEHFHAGFSGSHDARLDEALSRFVVRLNLLRRVRPCSRHREPTLLPVP